MRALQAKIAVEGFMRTPLARDDGRGCRSHARENGGSTERNTLKAQRRNFRAQKNLCESRDTHWVVKPPAVVPGGHAMGVAHQCACAAGGGGRCMSLQDSGGGRRGSKQKHQAAGNPPRPKTQHLTPFQSSGSVIFLKDGFRFKCFSLGRSQL